jgi:hypothetical protein
VALAVSGHRSPLRVFGCGTHLQNLRFCGGWLRKSCPGVIALSAWRATLKAIGTLNAQQAIVEWVGEAERLGYRIPAPSHTATA